MKLTIHGHEMDITEPVDGDVVVDVIVIARALHVDQDGTTQDSLIMDNTRHTTYMVQRGMLDAADQASLMELTEVEGDA